MSVDMSRRVREKLVSTSTTGASSHDTPPAKPDCEANHGPEVFIAAPNKSAKVSNTSASRYHWERSTRVLNNAQRSREGLRATSGEEDNMARLEAENRQLRGRWFITTLYMPSNVDRCCQSLSPSTSRSDSSSGTRKGVARRFPTYRKTIRSSRF